MRYLGVRASVERADEDPHVQGDALDGEAVHDLVVRGHEADNQPRLGLVGRVHRAQMLIRQRILEAALEVAGDETRGARRQAHRADLGKRRHVLEKSFDIVRVELLAAGQAEGEAHQVAQQVQRIVAGAHVDALKGRERGVAAAAAAKAGRGLDRVGVEVLDLSDHLERIHHRAVRQAQRRGETSLFLLAGDHEEKGEGDLGAAR